MHSKAIALVGPTASGKSDIAIELAKKYNGEIISCDSRQIYRGMDIGTGKVISDRRPMTDDRQRGIKNKNSIPTLKFSTPPISREIQTTNDFFSEGIRHWMIDIVGPNTDYSVVKFQKKANKAIADILRRGKLPILCGGTGLWAQAVVENMLFPSILPNIKLRNELRNHTSEALFLLLKKIDPSSAGMIDSKNRHRLIRAIEIASQALSSQGVPKEKNKQSKKIQKKNTSNLNFPTPILSSEICPTQSEITWQVFALNPPREMLLERIEKRLYSRLDEGMINEVATLHKNKRISWIRLDSFGLEYRQISRHLKGDISFAEMCNRILIDSRRYAKRQLTWLRRWEKMGRKIYWVTSAQEIELHISKYL